MRAVIALLLMLFIICYCAGMVGFLANLLISPINHDLGLFVGCFVSVAIFWQMWKKLLSDHGPNTPGTPGIQE